MADSAPVRGAHETRRKRVRLGCLTAAVGAAVLTTFCPAAAAPATTSAEPPSSFTVTGIDTSRWQHEGTDESGRRRRKVIDWPLVAESRSFVFHKATQGTTGTDPYFADDFAAADRTSLLHAPYHFFDPRNTKDGAAQARHFVRVARAAGYRGPSAGQLPPAVDIEKIRGRCPASLRSGQIRAFLSTVKKAFGVAPIVYTSARFVNDCMAGEGQALSGHLQWLARYSRVQEPPELPGTDRTWAFWQHSNKGRTPGVTGNVDLDVFGGTYAQLEELAGR